MTKPKRDSQYMQGQFKPLNPSKYKGNVNNIIYRSGWELKMMFKLDTDPAVLAWSSEEVRIPYRSPVDNIIHTYLPDFWVRHVEENIIKHTVYEVKPKIQTQPPKRGKRTTKKYLREAFAWGINQSKWKAAIPYCKSKGWEFQILTEHDLGIKYGRRK